MVNVPESGHTVKSTDPTIVARATTYSGNVAFIFQVDSEEALAGYAEHWKYKQEQALEHGNEELDYK